MVDYKARHAAAVLNPVGFERPIVGILNSWLEYGETHRARYHSGIGEDGVLGDEWQRLGCALLGMLNGETGRLDCGTLDRMIRDALNSEGFDGDAS